MADRLAVLLIPVKGSARRRPPWVAEDAAEGTVLGKGYLTDEEFLKTFRPSLVRGRLVLLRPRKRGE